VLNVSWLLLVNVSHFSNLGVWGTHTEFHLNLNVSSLWVNILKRSLKDKLIEVLDILSLLGRDIALNNEHLLSLLSASLKHVNNLIESLRLNVIKTLLLEKLCDGLKLRILILRGKLLPFFNCAVHPN
jgi:hypothetical protein